MNERKRKKSSAKDTQDIQGEYNWLPILKELENLERLELLQDVESLQSATQLQYITSSNTVDPTTQDTIHASMERDTPSDNI